MENYKNVTWPGWETVRLIGRGSFGAVYEIQRKVFDDIEKAALKVITIPQNASDIDEMYSDGYDDESITSTFHDHLKSIVAEYSLMRKMNGSANIVNCDDVRYVQHDDGIGWDIFIKMELLSPLTQVLPGEVSEKTVIQIAKDMCAALELCKRHEIVHRDIKPQNIFVSPNGDYKLGDFGIAKTVERTSAGTKIGTYKYMAPEVNNNQPYGHSADIYSLGLVLYWLLNERRMPFMPLPPEAIKAGQEEEARCRRLSGEPLPAPAHGSEALKRIVVRACAYDPKNRYASAVAMLDDVNRIIEIPTRIPSGGTLALDSEEMQEDDKTVGMIFSGISPQKPAGSSVAPVQQPAYRQPTRQIGYQKPAQQPAYQQPVRQMGYQKPVQQPVHRQPAQQPAYRQPVQQIGYQNPIQQPRQRMDPPKPTTVSSPAAEKPSSLVMPILCPLVAVLAWLLGYVLIRYTSVPVGLSMILPFYPIVAASVFGIIGFIKSFKGKKNMIGMLLSAGGFLFCLYRIVVVFFRLYQ